MARPKKLEGKTKAEKDKIRTDFEKLCLMQCTEAEICAFFDVTDKTLARWCKEEYGVSFSEAYKSKSEAGKISIRRAQFLLAQKSAAMAIFLGKQYLGQRDNIQYEDRESLERLDAILAAMKDTAEQNATDGQAE